MGDGDGAVTITTLFEIEALSSPARVRILRYADRPITVTELADRLGVPTTRLYYHVNLLVEAGLLVQVDERRSGARTEMIYRRAGTEFKLGPDIVDVIGDRRKAAEAAATVLFDPARAEVEDFLEHTLGREQQTAHLGRSVVRLSAEAARGFVERLDELLDDVRELDLEDGEQSRTYSLTAAFIPVETWDEPS